MDKITILRLFFLIKESTKRLKKLTSSIQISWRKQQMILNPISALHVTYGRKENLYHNRYV